MLSLGGMMDQQWQHRVIPEQNHVLMDVSHKRSFSRLVQMASNILILEKQKQTQTHVNYPKIVIDTK